MTRPLSDIEKAIWTVDQVVRQNFIMVARLSGPLTESVLRQALDMTQEKHIPLKWRIKPGDIPEFVSENVPPIPLRVIKREDDCHWIKEAEIEMDKAFPFTEGPMVRVVLLSSRYTSDLLVTFCHIAADATSGLMVVKKILSNAGKITREETIVPETPLPESLSSIELFRKDLEFETQSAVSAELQSVELQGDREVPPEERITRIIHKVLPQTDTEKLVFSSKKEKTSVHTALCAAFFQAVVQQIRQQKKVPETGALMISCITPVNIRHFFTRPVEEDIGYYISFAVHYQLIDENAPLWIEARKIKEAIESEVNSGRDIEAILGVGETLKEFSKPIDLVKAINSSNPPIAVTNLGRLDIPQQYGDLKLEALHFPVAIHFDTKNGLAISVTTFRNRLFLNFLYAEPYISTKRANIICENMMKRLKEAIKE